VILTADPIDPNIRSVVGAARPVQIIKRSPLFLLSRSAAERPLTAQLLAIVVALANSSASGIFAAQGPALSIGTSQPLAGNGPYATMVAIPGNLRGRQEATVSFFWGLSLAGRVGLFLGVGPLLPGGVVYRPAG